MKVIKQEVVVAFDVDNTILMYEGNISMPGDGKLEVVDPNDNSIIFLKPHKFHISLLKKYKGRGFAIMVWSAAGSAWAEASVNALGISDYVDVVMSKPLKLVDDLPLKEFLPEPLYFKDTPDGK